MRSHKTRPELGSQDERTESSIYLTRYLATGRHHVLTMERGSADRGKGGGSRPNPPVKAKWLRCAADSRPLLILVQSQRNLEKVRSRAAEAPIKR